MLNQSYIKAMKCKGCGKEFPAERAYACDCCFSPLELVYDLDSIELDKNSFRVRPNSLWRYHELLPLVNKTKIVFSIEKKLFF